MPETVDVLVKGGAATPAPPLGPSLSPLGVNVGLVVKEINEKTAAFKGMDVPVKIIVDTATKKFTVVVGTPPVTALIKKELRVDKLAVVKEGQKTLPGDIALSAIVEIAKNKDMPGDLQARVTQVLGTCLSGGVTVGGRSPRDVIADIKSGAIAIE